jgi:hypothetical protein
MRGQAPEIAYAQKMLMIEAQPWYLASFRSPGQKRLKIGNRKIGLHP